MSQEQPMSEKGPESGAQPQCIRYGDVFRVTSDLASQLIAPQDAATMQMAEYAVLGAPQPGGAADVMTSAATLNQYTGVVRGNQASEAAQGQGITITETPIPGGKIVTECVAGQVVGQYAVPHAQIGGQGGAGDAQGNYEGRDQGDGDTANSDDRGGNEGDDQSEVDNTKLTIGEALEATACATGNEPVQPSDAAAISAAENTACGSDVTIPGGIGDAATAAATTNMLATRDEVKVTISDVLSNATAKLSADKPAEQGDAARVVDAEMGSKHNGGVRQGGVAVAVATAARLNQDNNS